MTEFSFNKVFLDTAPLIYFLDDDIHFGGKMREILEYILNSGKKMITSSVTCEEYLVLPYRTANRDKVDVFFEFTGDCHIDILPITVEIARKAAAIRAQYSHFIRNGRPAAGNRRPRRLRCISDKRQAAVSI